MASMSQVQARAIGHRIPRSADFDRELRRMRDEAAALEHDRPRRGLTMLLLAVVAGLLGFVVTAVGGEGGLAALETVAALFR